MKKRSKTLIVIGIIFVIAIVVAVKLKATHAKPTPPRTVVVRRGDLIVPVDETGTVTPDNQVDVKSKVAGRLLTIPVVEGQYVAKGQLIATVDTSQIDPQIKSTEAQLEQAEARLEQSIASYRLQVAQTQDAIEQAQAGLDSAKAHLETVKAGSRVQELQQQEQAVDRARIDLADAKRTQARKQMLVDKGFVAQSDVDAADVAVDTATSTLDSAVAQLNLLKAGPREEDVHEAQMGVESAQVQLDTAKANALQNDVRKSDIDQARGNVQEIQNQLAQLDVQLADTRILAPASGIVLKKYRNVNEIVQSATTSFSDSDSLVVTLGSKPKVRVDINEVDIPKVEVDDQVNVTVDSLPGETFAGKVATIAPVSSSSLTANSDSGSGSGGNAISKFPVNVIFTKIDHRLRPGMTVNVSIVSAEHKNVLIAPLEAIKRADNVASVSVLQPSGKQVTENIKLGIRNDTDAEVLSGLAVGDKLVAKPIDGSDRRKIDINAD